MTSTIRLSDPVSAGERTVIPVIRDTTLISECGCVGTRDPVGLIIMERGRAWLFSLEEKVTIETIDEVLGIK